MLITLGVFGMGFYVVSDLEKMLSYSKSKAYDEIKKMNAILINEMGVKKTYPGRIRKDLFELLTGPKKTTIDNSNSSFDNNSHLIMG
jgi:hypothetical protein